MILRPESLEFARYVIVFTTLPLSGFTPEAALDWYRFRWQVEPVFWRFRSVAQLGHLPKRDSESARVWLYGKLFTALLTEKLIAPTSALSPGGTRSSPPEVTPSRWREFRFQRTIGPDMPPQDVLAQWPEISRGLSESIRKCRP